MPNQPASNAGLVPSGTCAEVGFGLGGRPLLGDLYPDRRGINAKMKGPRVAFNLVATQVVATGEMNGSESASV